MKGGRSDSENCVDDGSTSCTDGVTTYGERSIDACTACTKYDPVVVVVVLGNSEAKVPLSR
jgi:hypothetical protein